MTTLRDALTEALGKSEEGTLETPQEVAIEANAPQDAPTEQPGRVRDENGRFASAEAEPQEVQPEPKPVRKPPSSWKKDYWNHWEKLGTNEELAPLQEYIEQREADFAKGVSTYKAQWDQAQPVYEAIQPFMPELQQHGIQPAQWIQNLGNAHRTLALGSPEQKLQMFSKLATEYGVDLNGLMSGQPNPQFGLVTDTVSQLNNQVQQLISSQKQAEEARLQSEIDAFKTNAPFFEEVRETMAGLLQSGMAPDLKTAYDKAIRLSDDVWQKHLAQQAKAEAQARQAEAAKKKAIAVSPKSSSPTGAMMNGSGKKGLRESLSESFDAVSSGRF